MEYLDLPGGRMEYGLTPEQNIIKEVKEEVGLDVRIIDLVGVYQFFRNDGGQVVCIVYLCEPFGKIDISKNPDKEENIFWFKWVDIKEFLDIESTYYKGLEDMKNMVKKVIESRLI